jgi:glutamyl-tRNA reductase
VALSAAAVRALLARLRGEPWASEALCVSTCNRTELYVVSPDPGATTLALAALRASAPDAPGESEGVFLRRVGEDAALHLFRVAAGLESAVLGETEIQGQVREAHRVGLEAATVGPFLDRLLRGALRAGKRVRTETGLSRGAVSHGHAAAEVARRVFGDLRQRSVLVVGAGEMATRAASALTALPGGRFVVANRSPEAADALASTLGAGAAAVPLDEVPRLLSTAHVAVFAGAGAPLDPAVLSFALERRRDPLLVLDYGVPRNVPPAVAEVPGVFLYDLDALEAVVETGLSARRDAVPDAERVLGEEVTKFRAWHRALRAAPALRSLAAWAEEVRRAEVEALPLDASEEVRAAVDDLTRRLVERLLVRPAARVRRGVEEGDPTAPTPDHLRNVFGLPEEDAG